MNERAAEPKLVVGIGASAGGLEALLGFFKNVPESSGLAFVVVTHLSPNSPSLLADLLGKQAAIPVGEVRERTAIAADHVYVAPPGRTLVVQDGCLELISPVEDGTNLPVDRFFRSLADALGERAVGVVLSGSGSDGTHGLKEIKDAGGMVMAQSETSAIQFGMPRSAIATDEVDYVAAAEELPALLVAYAARAVKRLGAPEEAPKAPHGGFAPIFKLLRQHTRHDFSGYKRSTIRRRIERRLNVRQIHGLDEYQRLLQENPAEIDLLFKELLIGVTSFFRDPEAWSVVEQEIARIIAEKDQDSVLRAWVAGCSTGEEAYSLAIAIRERLDAAHLKLGVQVFATDIDSSAVEIARAGVYAETIVQDVSAERLSRFFSREEGYYRIKKEIREMLIFAPQDLIGDPPFTKLDVLSCRNVLIYLDGSVQERLLPLFHYALLPGGVLFLGSSETLGASQHLFEVTDKRWKIFRRRDVAARVFSGEFHSTATNEPAYRGPAIPARQPADLGVTQLAERALFNNLVPPSVIVHERGEIVHVHGRTGQFLEPAPGPQSRANVFNMAREGLQLDLAAAMRAAAEDGEVLRRSVRVRTNGSFITVDLRVRRLSAPDALRGLFLVAFERPEAVSERAAESTSVTEASEQRVTELERELFHAKEVHQSVIEELETTNEELKSTNEELQSTNEELQSANEELETSKEEMQSLNEELHTVNTELQLKLDELGRTNDDMKNLLNGTSIATIFLDEELNIKRYTDQAKKVIRLISTDVGRPIGDLVSNLKYRALVDDCREVLRTLVFQEVEVQSEEGAWYLMRILPYRTADNVIDGLVLTFTDITSVKELQQKTERIIDVLQRSPTRVYAKRADLKYDWVSGALFDREPVAIVGRSNAEVLPGVAAGVLSTLEERVLASGHAQHDTFVTDDPRTGKATYDVHVTAARDPGGAIVGVTGVLTKHTPSC